MFGKLKRLLKTKAIEWLDDKGEPIQRPNIVGGWNMGNILDCYHTGSYDNNFPNITRIAESFAEVAPFAVDANGEKLKQQPRLIGVLNNPNEDMAGSEFWETLAVMLLVHPVVYLLCWRREGRNVVPGGRITADNIAGFTFMEGVGVSTINGSTTYYYNGQTYDKYEVIALSLNVNPYDLSSGYSPSMAAKKWANVDDYVADYQAGYFRNGAVPAGQFVVTARDGKEFNDMVDALQAHHRGASNANNPVYVHRPISAIDDKPLGAQVEWVPFAQSTEKGTLQSIFDQANKKIDMDFGVPQEVKGYLQNSNYASAEVADYIFSRRVVYPKLRKVFSKFMHEFDRIVGGAGFALSFDYEIPVLTEVRKAQAETLQIMLGAGFTVESAVDALQLPSSFKELEKAEAPAENGTDNNQADTPIEDELASTDQPAQKAIKAKALDTGETIESDNQVTDKRLTNALRGLNEGVINIAADLARNGDSTGLEQLIRSAVQEQGLVDYAAKLIVSVLIAIMLERGEQAAQEFATELGLTNLNMEISPEKIEELTTRITELLQQFVDQTIAEIMSVVERISTIEGYDDDALVRDILELKIADEYRYDRWAVSERYEAEQNAVLIAAIIASEQAGLVAYKTWRIDPTSNDLCVDCLRMDGETVRADQPFSNGDMIPHYHPWCRCKAEFTWRRAEKSIKIACPSCGRYMMESTGGNMKNVICANSKCKKHFDIEVKCGKVKATERRTK